MGVLDVILLPFRIIGFILSFLSFIALFAGVVGLIYGLFSGDPEMVPFAILVIAGGSVGLIIGRILTGGGNRKGEPYRGQPHRGPPPGWEAQQRQQREFQRQQQLFQQQQQQQQEFQRQQQRRRMQW